MAGLARICKMYGAIVINGQRWVWDYAADKPALEQEMTAERRKLSEQAKWEAIKRPVEVDGAL